MYQKLGAAKGPSVLGKCLIAFVLPIILFVLSLAAMDRFLRGPFENQDLRMLAGILPALIISVAGVAIARRIFLARAENERQGVPISKTDA